MPSSTHNLLPKIRNAENDVWDAVLTLTTPQPTPLQTHLMFGMAFGYASRAGKDNAALVEIRTLANHFLWNYQFKRGHHEVTSFANS